MPEQPEKYYKFVTLLGFIRKMWYNSYRAIRENGSEG